MKKIWKLKTLYSQDRSEDIDIDAFTKEMRSLKTNVQLPDIILRLLYIRGIRDYQKVLKFFRPSIDKLYDPALMKDCDKAAHRVIEAIDNKESIMILGDYDVDGTCGVSMFYLFLKKNFGLEPDIYIPDRIDEGYGISVQAINLAKEKKISLIIAIDCGITAAEKIDYAKSIGVDFIICDHHQPPAKIPDAVAVMDPVREDDEYPFKYLCGTGVAFKLAQRISAIKGNPDMPNSLIDLVAIATASDIVPLYDENRILVKEGFDLINKKPRLSLKVLIESSGLKVGNLTTSNMVFTLAPRINAVGRLGDAKRAVELLTCEDSEKINEFAFILNDENQTRRGIDKTITDDVYKIYDESKMLENKRSIVIHNEEWHPGVVGIVAARLVEKYNMPSIVLTTVNGVGKGSARSINSFNIYEALKQCTDLLIQFGGHYHAAGLEIELSKIDEFKKVFNEIASNEISDAQMIPEIEVDAEITLEELNEKIIKILSFFEPFGPENMAPVFVTKDLQIIGDVRFTNKANTHIFKVMENDTKKIFESIFFNSPDYRFDEKTDAEGKGKIRTGNFCDICYSVDRSLWNGREYTKLRIRDMVIN
ncbi:MAG TPA: single-stranded-DNA-specific exonuclease RecJ [Ignavibacteria bacterium]|nr:single-stranded-DNA-specific exonuclease RecJ [Ignavibacteria bacterium]